MPSCPTESPASGKMKSQWEIPLSSHPHDIPTATLANCIIGHVQAPVQRKQKHLRQSQKNSPPPAGSTKWKPYNLLADILPLSHPKKSLVRSVIHDGFPKAKDREGELGLTHLPNHWQQSSHSPRSATHQPMRFPPSAQETINLCWSFKHLAKTTGAALSPTSSQVKKGQTSCFSFTLTELLLQSIGLAMMLFFKNSA